MTHRQIRMKRLRLGISQKEIAERVGISAARLCFFERYGMNLQEEIVSKLERILDEKQQKQKK